MKGDQLFGRGAFGGALQVFVNGNVWAQHFENSIRQFMRYRNWIGFDGGQLLYAFPLEMSAGDLVSKKDPLSGSVDVSVLTNGELTGEMSEYYPK